MSTVLAIDTSTSQTSVALVENGKVIFNKSHLDPLAHGEVLPKLVAQALKLTSKIDLVAVGMGPGPVYWFASWNYICTKLRTCCRN